jgi:hypothetical protein
MAFASHEVQTIASDGRKRQKNIHEYIGIAYRANEDSMIEI